ncbi:RCC1 and BTB domain-containing protein 1-like [Cloeon dipterum]|uniref:RCC1 and BTB domain-containing protein 1-like n=1 Tax=Cloeon dipterum TaxID=197152 RepID=UPI00321FA697
MSSSLAKWSIFRLLGDRFSRDIRLAMVFGNSGGEAIFVTHNDEVFSIGGNLLGCLGTGDTALHIRPKKIDELCGMNIIGFASGHNQHVVAISSSGAIYSWGLNRFGELGLGTLIGSLIPVQIPGFLATKTVVQVECADHFTIARTSDGQVFTWGLNDCGQLGLGHTTNVTSPSKVEGMLGGRFVSTIACGQSHCMAVLDSGELFAWGGNVCGQLGLGHKFKTLRPCKVTGLQGAKIARVACGYDFTLALSDTGVVYAWGQNDWGQLGTQTTFNDEAISPIVSATGIGRVTDISALHYNNRPCAAVNENGNVYFWGTLPSAGPIFHPILTRFSSLIDVYAALDCVPVSLRSFQIPVDENPEGAISACLRKSFDDPETADLVVRVEGKEISLHKSLLIMRCSHFRIMFQGNWKESEQRELVVNDFSYDAYYAFFKYLYTNEVDATPEVAIELFVLADFYLDSSLRKACEDFLVNFIDKENAAVIHEHAVRLNAKGLAERCLLQVADMHLMPGLQAKCVQLIKLGVTVTNAALIYANAVHNNAKELEDFCFNFCLNHMTAVVNSDGFTACELQGDTTMGFFRRAANGRAFIK